MAAIKTMATITTNYGKDGQPTGVPANYTGELIVWGFDCVPDHFEMVNGKIAKTIFVSRGDWTKI